MKDKTFIETDTQYHNGVCMEEYNSDFGICRANKGQDGTIYVKWGYAQAKNRQPAEKGIPWKVILGPRSQAIAILESFLAELKGDNTKKTEVPEVDVDEIPF